MAAKKREAAMQRRKWDPKTKAMIVLYGLKATTAKNIRQLISQLLWH
ncbi:MAG: hypothetical protein JW901_08040 [Dehalococcoidia bacterium]|nr:hypothetical protein [Dehalococcoidia bacterium]